MISCDECRIVRFFYGSLWWFDALSVTITVLPDLPPMHAVCANMFPQFISIILGSPTVSAPSLEQQKGQGPVLLFASALPNTLRYIVWIRVELMIGQLIAANLFWRTVKQIESGLDAMFCWSILYCTNYVMITYAIQMYSLCDQNWSVLYIILAI